MPNTLYEYYKSRGQNLPSLNDRTSIANQAGITNYSGSASQNSQLLNFLQAQNNQQINTSPNTQVNDDEDFIGKGVGAGGRAEWGLTDAQINEALNNNVPMSEMETFYTEPRLNNEQSAGFLDAMGLSGILNPKDYFGLTRSEAMEKANADKMAKSSKVSANTSYAFNQDYMAPLTASKLLINGFTLGLKDTENPFNPNEEKNKKKNNLIENTTTEFAKLFNNPAQFDNYYNSDSEFRKIMDTFQRNGGSPDAVRNILQRGVVQQNQENQQKIPAVTATNPVMSGLADATNMQIALSANIPEKYRSVYFGDNGYFTNIRKDAENQLSSLEKTYENIKQNTSDAYKANVAKVEAEANLQLAQIEEQRQDSKTYMTGLLAKLGALKTTGASGATIQRLDAKYNNAALQVQSALSNAKATLASNYSNAIQDIESESATRMNAIMSDTRKTAFQIQMELLNLEQETQDRIGSLISNFENEAYSYDKEAYQLAQKNASDYEMAYLKAALDKSKADLDLSNAKDLAEFKAMVDAKYGGATKITDTQYLNAGYAQRIKNSSDIFSSPISANSGLSGDEYVAGLNPTQYKMYRAVLNGGNDGASALGSLAYNFVGAIPEEFKKVDQAQRSFINAVLRKESGAAISPGEFDSAAKQYFAQPGDTASVIDQKKQNRDVALNTMINSSGQAWNMLNNTNNNTQPDSWVSLIPSGANKSQIDNAFSQAGW